MELSDEAKVLCVVYKAVPIVGLIHKETKSIVLAPCMLQKVILELNDAGEAISGCLKGYDSSLSDNELADCNALLKKGYVPRVVYAPKEPFEEISAHQLLFQEKCQSTASSDWGGFTLTFDSSGQQCDYTFVSGAFNSPRGKREQGAILCRELQLEVRRQTAVLMDKPQDTQAHQDFVSPPRTGSFFASSADLTRSPRKRQCMAAESKNGSTFGHV